MIPHLTAAMESHRKRRATDASVSDLPVKKRKIGPIVSKKGLSQFHNRLEYFDTQGVLLLELAGKGRSGAIASVADNGPTRTTVKSAYLSRE